MGREGYVDWVGRYDGVCVCWDCWRVGVLVGEWEWEREWMDGLGGTG